MNKEETRILEIKARIRKLIWKIISSSCLFLAFIVTLYVIGTLEDKVRDLEIEVKLLTQESFIKDKEK